MLSVLKKDLFWNSIWCKGLNEYIEGPKFVMLKNSCVLQTRDNDCDLVTIKKMETIFILTLL